MEIPCLIGESRLVYPPEPPGDARQWFINDHCFYTAPDGLLHWFGINNPYLPGGERLYEYHPYIGHATATDPLGEWTRCPWAIDDSDGAQYLGAPWVAWLPGEGRYVMLFESKIAGRRELELAYSTDLFTWQRTGQPVLAHLAHTKRDPCVISGDQGEYLLYLCTPSAQGSSITVTPTRDFRHYGETRTCLLIEDGVSWGGLESPFVLRRGSLYYLFATYAHRHYDETMVWVSERHDHFAVGDVVTTLYGHAAEIFEHAGKTFISSCGPEDCQHLNRHGLYLAELAWAAV
jgi:hypothetical protein